MGDDRAARRHAAAGAHPHPLAPYVARVALDWLAEEPERRARTVQGSLLFADVSGFTPLTERLARAGKVGAEELTDVLNEIFGRLLTVAASSGGDLVKFGGDALLLLFTGHHHETRAAGCAQRLLETLRPYKRFRAGGSWLRLTMHCGLESGPVQLLLVGDTHRELFAVGPVVSATVDLENAASGGQVLVGPAAARALDPALLGDAVGPGRLLVGHPAAVPLTTVAPEGAEADLGLPAVLREHLRLGRAEGEHRVASLAFLQLRGTDALLRDRGLDAVAAEVERVVVAAQRACLAHGVTFLATDVDADGGKILFVAGAPHGGDRDEDNLLLALRETVATDGVLEVRAGANRGRAFAVDVGADDRRTYAVMGDATNLSARVMGKAGRGEVLATRALLDKVHGEFVLEPRAPFLVKGKPDPVSAAVVGERLGGRAQGADLPFVGRELELEVLTAALAAVREGPGTVVELVGEPGLGKSRLVAELLRAAPHAFVLRVEGGQYGAATPYAAVRAPLRSLVGARPEDDDAVVVERLRVAATRSAPEVLPWLPLLATLLGVDLPDTPETAALDPKFRASVRHLQGASLLGRVLPTETVVLVEDANWLDDASGELLDHVAAVAAEHHWLVCVTRRPGDQGWRPDPGLTGTVVPLEPLTEAESSALLRRVALDRPLAPTARAIVAARGAGNPLFLRELLESVGDGQDGTDVSLLPDTLEGVISIGVDQLPRADRELLRVAAVLGTGIEARTLSRMLDRPVDDVHAALHRLERFLVEDARGGLRFVHGIVRDVAYEGLPFKRRRTLHGRAGDLLRTHLAEQESLVDLLALHYRSADRPEEAWHYARLAGERARRSSAPVEAARYYRWALDASTHLPSVAGADRADVGERLGDMLELDGRYDEASAAFASARRLVGDDVLRVVGLLKKEGWVRERSGRYSSALSWYTRALRRLDDLDPAADAAVPADDVARARAQLTMSYGAARARQGRYADAVPYLEGAAAEAQRLDDQPTLAHCYYLLDWALTDLGRPEAADYREQALPIYERLGDLVGQATVLNNLGIDAYYEGRWDTARELYERCRELCHRSGNVVMDGTALNNIGEILSDQGHLGEAEAVFVEALALWRSVRFPVGLGLCLSNLGRVASRGGRWAEALDHFVDARSHFVRIGADAFLVELDAREAERLVLRGEAAEAFAVAGDAAVRAGALGGMPVVLAMLDRLRGVARAQLLDVEGAVAHLQSSRTRASEAKAEYELALTLHEWSRVGELVEDPGAAALEAAAMTILGSLGVSAVPDAPLSPLPAVRPLRRAAPPAAATP